MSDSEVDYLQDGFNPQSLTVPRLRSILVTYNINYPATAKKPQLVDLFNEQVVPQAKKILAQRARAKRSSMGIVDANAPSGSASFDDHEDLLPPQPVQRARSPRKSARVKRESEEPEAMPELRSPRKRSTRSASRQLSEAETTDTDAPSRGSRRLRGKTPQIKEETTDEETEYSRPVTREHDDDVFTSDNPFQSGGSSPPAPMKTPTNRRKTTGMEQRKSENQSALRRRTDGPSETMFQKTFEIPIQQLRSQLTPEPEMDVVEAGEEFTPDAQLEMAQEEAEQAARGIVTRRPARAKKGSVLTTPLCVLAATLLGAYGAWYRQEKIIVGYCGVGGSAKSIIPSSVELPDWVHNIEVPEVLRDIQLPEWAKIKPEFSDLPNWAQVVLEPQCEPCPPHAYCHGDFTVTCESDYILKPHPLSLGGIIPLPPTCEPDGEKARRVKVVADKAVEELRDRKAKFECGELVDEDGKKAETPAVDEEVLKEVISEKRSKRLSKDEFDDLWGAAIGEVEAREEVEIVYPAGSPGDVPARRFSSTSLARVPLGCALRLSIRHSVARYRLHVSILVLSILASLYGRARYRSHRSTTAQIPALVDLVLERLSSQKELSYEVAADGANDEDPFLFLPNLRDDVLRATHSLAERDRVWQRVRAVVEQNSNVRTAQREGNNGEVGRAWEWIGPLAGAIESSAHRWRSGRVSRGVDVKDEMEDGEADGLKPVKQETDEKAAANRRWQESRPIY